MCSGRVLWDPPYAVVKAWGILGEDVHYYRNLLGHKDKMQGCTEVMDGTVCRALPECKLCAVGSQPWSWEPIAGPSQATSLLWTSSCHTLQALSFSLFDFFFPSSINWKSCLKKQQRKSWHRPESERERKRAGQARCTPLGWQWFLHLRLQLVWISPTPSGDLCYKPKGDVGRPFGGKREGVSGNRSSPFEGAESTPNNHNWVKTLITGGSISLGCFGSLLDPLQHIQNKLRAKIRGSQILQLNADKQERRIWDSGVCNAWKKDYFFLRLSSSQWDALGSSHGLCGCCSRYSPVLIAVLNPRQQCEVPVPLHTPFTLGRQLPCSLHLFLHLFC